MQVILRRLWIQITSDRRRFGILCAVLAIGLLLWGRIIITSSVPRTVMADPEDGAPSAHGAADPDGTSPRPTRTIQLADGLRRDPLAVSEAYFPKPNNVEALPQVGPKSDGEPADDPEQADRRRTLELQGLAGKFRLDGVVQGRPMAVINGRTYHLDDWLPAVGDGGTVFQLVEVSHRSVVLECEGRRFKLSMEFPGNVER